MSVSDQFRVTSFEAVEYHHTNVLDASPQHHLVKDLSTSLADE